MNTEFTEKFYNYVEYPYWWQRINPLHKFVFCLCVGLAAFINSTWWYGLGVMIFCIGTLISVKKLKQVMGLLIVLIGVGGILTMIIRIISHLDDGGPVAFYLFGQPIPMSGIMSAVNYIVMMYSFFLSMLTYFAATEMRDICYCLENQLHVPPIFSFMTLSAITSMTSIGTLLTTVKESQAARGIEMEGDRLTKIKAVLPTLFPVIISSLTSVEGRTLAMDTRAFAAKGKHTALRRVRPPKFSDYIWSCAGVVIIIVMIVSKIRGW